MQLSDQVFAVKSDAGIVHEVVVAAQANARRAIASTKTRGEVRGGGKKPWKQKGTGRARQGSIRSPQWIGGGITFGPTSERNFAIKVNKKVKRKAMLMALSDKVASEKFVIVDAITAKEPKTKVLATALKSLPVERTTLVVAPSSNPALVRMARNMPNVKCVTVQSLSLLDVLGYRSMVVMQEAVPAMEKMFA
jgi:large subunit ribosomal protein L4